MFIRKVKRYISKARRFVFAALFTVFLVLSIVSAAQIIAGQTEYAQARQEYELLRQYAPTAAAASSAVPAVSDKAVLPEVTMPPAAESSSELRTVNNLGEATANIAESESVPAYIPTQAPTQRFTPNPTPSPAATPEPIQLSEINPDYIGWIRIEGTNIDYPIVQGEDNDEYLSVSFAGDRNASGAIFMDSRCSEQFESPLTILYGHNMDDGSMFADLNRYLDSEYYAEHTNIDITTPDGVTCGYRVAAVRYTDVTDTAYTLVQADKESVSEYLTSIGMVVDSQRILALSTCTHGGGDDKRLLVLATPE